MTKTNIWIPALLCAALSATGCKGNSATDTEAPAGVVQASNSKTKITEEKRIVKIKNAESDSTIKNGFPEKPAVGTKALCPVMKNEFTITESTQMSEYEGKTYAFCCPGCKPQFDADPPKYL